jgi:hypothetical protein
MSEIIMMVMVREEARNMRGRVHVISFWSNKIKLNGIELS